MELFNQLQDFLTKGKIIMTKFKKIMATIIVAASVSSMGVVSYAVTPRNQVTPNDYVTFAWGAGYATTTNNSEQTRMAYASVDVFKDTTGVQVDHNYNDESLPCNESVTASVSGYSSNGYNFKCSGGIYASNTFSSPIVWSDSYNVQ